MQPISLGIGGFLYLANQICSRAKPHSGKAYKERARPTDSQICSFSGRKIFGNAFLFNYKNFV